MTARGRVVWRVALVVGVICAASGQVWAAPPAGAGSGVLVIRPPAGDAVLEEASLRIRSELQAAGTSSQLIDCSPPGTPPANCTDSSAAARISLSREEGIATIQVTASLPDGLELRRHVRVSPESGGGDPSVLAVRAVELLRDIYLDIPRVDRKPEPAPVPSVPSPAPAPPAAAPPVVVQGRAFLGWAVLQGRWGLGAASAPAFGLGLTLYGRLSVVVGIAGPFHERVGSAAEGMAETWQTLGALQLRYEIGAGRVRPFASAGLGLYGLRARGEPQPSPGMEVAVSRARLAPLVTAGLGLMVKIFPWLAATIEAHEIVTWPLDIKSDSNVIGRAGGPSELLQAGLVVWAP